VSIDVERADPADRDTWDDRIERSGAGTVFHRWDALEVVERHAGATLHPLVGYKGQEPVGLLPAYEISKGGVSTVFSPPPGMGLPSLGPVTLAPDDLKQRKRERRNRRFVTAALEWLADECSPKYERFVTPVGYGDPRPFTWEGFDVSPRFTYQVDLRPGSEAVMDSFKKSLRSDIRRSLDEDYDVRRGDRSDVAFVVERVRERYEAQGESYSLQTDYVTDLYDALADDHAAVYVGHVDGERVSGIVRPAFDGTMYYWQGGGKPDLPLPMNDLIHWEMIQDAIAEGIETYDLVGANTERICQYKAKFNPDLRPYYEVERGTRAMNLVSEVYRRFR